MEPDQLQWLWDGVDEFRFKFNELRERAVRNFQLPFNVTVVEHDVNCGLQSPQTCMPCSCCKGALTIEEAKLIK